MSGNDLDTALAGLARELFARFERELPRGSGAVLIAYSTDGAALDIAALVTNDATKHYLRVLDAARAFAVERSRDGEPRVYELPRALTNKYPTIDADVVVSRIEVAKLADGSEVLRMWNRGDRAGELVAQAGDGARIAATFGLVLNPETDDASVEWHVVGDYRVSFDARVGPGRFIILRGPGDLVGQGLIEAPGRGGVGRAIFDVAPAPDDELASVTMTMLSHWEAMQARLRARAAERAAAERGK